MKSDAFEGSPALHEFQIKLAQEFARLYAEIDRKNLTIKALTEERDEVVRLTNKLTAERDALWRLTDRLYAEHDALRAERDEVRKSYCSLMEAYRGGDGRVTANKLGWGYLFEEDKP